MNPKVSGESFNAFLSRIKPELDKNELLIKPVLNSTRVLYATYDLCHFISIFIASAYKFFTTVMVTMVAIWKVSN